MEALCTTGFFVALPGPARMAVVDHLMSDASRQQCWSNVSRWAPPACVPGRKDIIRKIFVGFFSSFISYCSLLSGSAGKGSGTFATTLA